MADFLLRPSTVAKVFDMSVRHIYELIKSGAFEVRDVNPGGRGGVRVTAASMLDFVERHSFVKRGPDGD